MSTIMVQVTDKSHTLTALRAACDLACKNQHDIVLLKLVPVTHPSWLGTELGNLNLSDQDQRAFREYQLYAKSRAVTAKVSCLQSVTSVEAIIWAAECVKAQIVFAHLPHSLIPFWRLWQRWLLRRHLEQLQCQLYLSDGAAAPNWIAVQRPSTAHK
jgi:hypothetical protein